MALEEDSLQDLMAACSNGASLKEWSYADAVKAITLWSMAGPGTRHLGGHAAGSGRKAATVDSSCESEESQDEEDNNISDSSDRTIVTFSFFLPVLILSCTYIF